MHSAGSTAACRTRCAPLWALTLGGEPALAEVNAINILIVFFIYSFEWVYFCILGFFSFLAEGIYFIFNFVQSNPKP